MRPARQVNKALNCHKGDSTVLEVLAVLQLLFGGSFSTQLTSWLYQLIDLIVASLFLGALI